MSDVVVLPVTNAARDIVNPDLLAGSERVHRFPRIVQARPGYICGLVGDHDLVKGLVAFPQRLPGGAFVRPQRPKLDVGYAHAAPGRFCLAIRLRRRECVTA